MLLCLLIHASFVGVVLLFLFHYEKTTNAKFIFYAKENGSWTWKAWRYKDGGEAGEVSLMMSVDVQSFNIIVWPRPFLKWPDLKCDGGHMTHLD